MRFGVREIANVTFRPLAAMDIASQHFDKYQPCLYIDTATASNMEVATTTVYAQGGRGNARLIAWEGEKTATFTITDALLSPISFAMLSGAGAIKTEGGAGGKVVHMVYETSFDSSGKTVDLTKLLGSDTLVLSGKTDDPNYGLDAYITVLDKYGQPIEYLTANEIDQPSVAGAKSISAREANSDYKNAPCRVDCYVISHATVTTLTVDAENFGGTFYIEAETLFRDEATGQDFPATFIIPKGKIQGNFTFNMASTGDPSTFDFTIDCTLAPTRTDETKKVLYAIDIIDTISDSGHDWSKEPIDDHGETTFTKKPVNDKGVVSSSL